MPVYHDPIQNRPASVQQLSAEPSEQLMLGLRDVYLTDEDYTLDPRDGRLILAKGSGADQTITLPTGDQAKLDFPKGYAVTILMPDAPTANGFVTSGVDGSEVDMDTAGEHATIAWFPDLGTNGEWHSLRALAQIEAGTIDTAQLADDSVTAAKIDYTVRAGAADTNVVIAADDDVITFSSTSGGAGNTITNGTMIPGKLYTLVMTAYDTNAFTGTVSSGTLTFDAADESATVYYDGSDIRVAALYGATVV